MKIIRKYSEIHWGDIPNCHNGKGVVKCKSLLEGIQSDDFHLMHYDEIKAGVTIGEHSHQDDEEIYFMLSGSGVLTCDGVEYDFSAGDISICRRGHSHGFVAKEDSVMIVVGSK